MLNWSSKTAVQQWGFAERLERRPRTRLHRIPVPPFLMSLADFRSSDLGTTLGGESFGGLRSRSVTNFHFAGNDDFLRVFFSFLNAHMAGVHKVFEGHALFK